MGRFLVNESSLLWMRSQIIGHFDDAACEQVMTVVDGWRGQRVGYTVFCDISAMDDYDVPARERISVWLRSLGDSLERLHVLVDGRTIAWALKIVTVTSGARIEPYHSRAAYDAAFERHVQRATETRK